MNHQEALTAYLAAFVAELVNTGVKDVVVSPGSRSTPMAMVMAENPGLNLHILVDERSAAFFALGIAKASGRPAAILCTSGTAAANYFPAIVEAYYSRVPLIVLTADRPHELRDVGAPQAIDQLHLFGKHVKWFAEMALPENSSELIRYARTICARATATALKAPSGPVHLNFPFREPLIPNIGMEGLFEMNERPEGFVAVRTGAQTLHADVFEEIATKLMHYKKGIIVCGQLDDADFASQVEKLASVLDYPILADPLSQLRSGGHSMDLIIDAYDAFLRDDGIKECLKPEIVIRFGAMPVSKALSIFLKENHQCNQYVIDGGGGWRDPNSLSTEMVYCDETLFCEGLLQFLTNDSGSSYSKNWININIRAKQLMEKELDKETLSESVIFHQLTEMLPEGATLFVGNSMPIRDLDSFFWQNNKSIKVMANRGANGIDGIISSALGAALYSRPLYLVLGDLTFYHDLNGLLAAKLFNIDVTIILINNNGGGIFSFLPQSGHPKNFEKLFGTPLDLNFEHVVTMYGGSFTRINDYSKLADSLAQSSNIKGLKVIEVVTDRELNTVQHRNLWNSVSREISVLLDGVKD